jgi:Type II restriction endonuclease EcoO109I
MINEILAAHLSSSDEGIFGEEFFEPICQALSGAQTAAAKGVDFVIETSTAFEAISLKSGPNAFNSSQVSKQNQQFEEIQNSLRATLRSLRKEFLPVMGCGYGRVDSPPTASRKYHKLAGQAFWEHITEDSQFYLKLVRFMRDDPDRHRPAFKEAWDRAVNRFVRQFSVDFCNTGGDILWDKLVEFNSGKARPERKKKKQKIGQS